MKKSVVLYVIGLLLILLGISQVVPLLVAVVRGEPGEVHAFLESIAASLITGSVLFVAFRGSRVDRNLRIREGFGVVAIGWAVVSAFGALPFLFASDLMSDALGPDKSMTFIDACFETMSGFTTTGASVFPFPSQIPPGILFWRSFTHWFGGMGIVVLTVAILPFLGAGGYRLMSAEVPGPTADRLAPRIAETAKYLWIIYVVLTVLEILLLLPSMGLYDASCHAFATLATGGFSTKDTSVAAFNSVYVEMVITAFMLLAGINFALHIQLIRGKGFRYLADSEFRFYMGLIAMAILVVSGFLYFSTYPEILENPTKYDTLNECVRHSTFQVVSLVTTTGFATADYDGWPHACRFILLLLMFAGGCAGSTGGGVKCVRLLLMMKYGFREMVQIIHPRAVLQVRINSQTVDREVVGRVMGFLALWLIVFALSVLLMNVILDSATGFTDPFETAFSSVLATMGNIGPGIADVGPAENFASIPQIGKVLLIFCMLLGRLEIYCVLVLFAPATWK